MPMEIETADNLQYQFFPVSGQVFTFKVRAANDAHLALSPIAEESDPMYEIFLGGWSNSKSVIRKNRQKPDVVEAETPGILDAGEFRSFWIRWYDNVITVGREGEAAAFMSHEDADLFPVQFVGVCTGWGANGNWLLDVESGSGGGGDTMSPSAPDMGFTVPPSGGSYEWVAASQGELPPNAVEGGFDGSEPLYIGRAKHEDDLVPGKLHCTHGVCYIPWGGEEHSHADYEVLCGGGNGGGHWVSVEDGTIPPNAVPGGLTADGETLFVGRATHEGTLTVGKVQPSHQCCYISYGGREIAYNGYEILVSSSNE